MFILYFNGPARYVANSSNNQAYMKNPEGYANNLISNGQYNGNPEQVNIGRNLLNPILERRLQDERLSNIVAPLANPPQWGKVDIIKSYND